MNDIMGGPAFPNTLGREGEVTLWDWYAAHAPVDSIGTKYDDGVYAPQTAKSAAGEAAHYASVMLAERAKHKRAALREAALRGGTDEAGVEE